MRTLIISLILFVVTQVSWATHIVSYELSYQHIDDSKYIISCDRILSCGGAYMWLGGLPPTPTVTFIGYRCNGGSQLGSIPLHLISEDTMPTFCLPNVALNSCVSGAAVGLSGFRLARYQDTVSLDTISSCDSLRFYISTGARTQSINVQSMPGYYTDIIIAQDVIQKNSSTENWHFDMPASFVDSSHYSISLAGFDVDGDSLTYGLDTAWLSFNFNNMLSVIYASGYTPENPVPNFQIDSLTGQLTWETEIPTSYVWANFIVNVRTDEWDPNTGNFKGSRYRDMQFWVLPESPLENPVFDGMTNLEGARLLDTMDILACAGDTFCFDVTFSDSDLIDDVTISSNLEYFADYYSISQVGVNPATATICAVINRVYEYGVDAVIKARDNHCPMIGMGSVRLHIRTVGPRNESIAGCFGNGDTITTIGDSLSIWSVISGDTIDSINFNCIDAGCTSVTLSPFNSTVYEVENVMSFGCSVIDTLSYLTDSTILLGLVVDGNNVALPNTSVYRFQYDALNDTVFLLDSAVTDNNGAYTLALSIDSFLLKISPDSATYPNLFPTYYNQKVTVPTADFLYPTYCDTLEVINTMVAGQNPGGPGFIGGYVSQGAGRGVGDPLKGIFIILMNSSMNPVMYRTTNAQGYFRFSNLALDEYFVYVDRWCMDNSLAPVVTLTEEILSVDSLQFLLNPCNLELVKPTGIDRYSSTAVEIFPNPADDRLFIRSSSQLQSVTLYDMLGNLVLTLTIQAQSAEISTQKLSAGWYIVEATNSLGNRAFDRIAITH